MQKFVNSVPRRNHNFFGARLTSDDGNLSALALSQGDVGSVQGKDELREQS